MKLILTGHDYAGKSTVLKKLFQREDNGKMSYIHLSYREPTTLEFYSNTLDFSNFIMDRCFLDELVYPMIFGRRQNLNKSEAKELLKKCKEQDIFIGIVSCSQDEIVRRIKERVSVEEEPEVLANIFLIKKMYEYLASEFDIPLIDTTGKTPDQIIEEIDKLIKERTIHNSK